MNLESGVPFRMHPHIICQVIRSNCQDPPVIYLIVDSKKTADSLLIALTKTKVDFKYLTAKLCYKTVSRFVLPVILREILESIVKEKL